MILNNDTSHGAAQQWSNWLAPLAGLPGLRFLEIGSWTGTSAAWFLRNILTADDSSLICIDTFAGGGGMPEVPDDSIYTKFVEHVNEWWPKIHVMKQRSEVALGAINRDIIDVVFIDGSHRIEDVLTDSVMAWCCLKPGGYMIWDDYDLKHEDPKLEPRLAIDTFLSIFKGEYAVIGKDYQLCIRKHLTKSDSPPESAATKPQTDTTT